MSRASVPCLPSILKAEAQGFLGQAAYRRATRWLNGWPSRRNGYYDSVVKTIARAVAWRGPSCARHQRGVCRALVAVAFTPFVQF